MSDERDGVPVSVAWILIAALAAALFVTGQMREPDATTDFPAVADDLTVVTVADAIAVQQVEAGTDVAVSGWYEQAPFLPCRAPDPESVPLLNGNCNIDRAWLMAEPESVVDGPPSGPAIHPVFDGRAAGWTQPAADGQSSTPNQVVFVGHFDDPRAADCQLQDLQLCLDRFVVTEVPWADGADNP